MNARAAQTGTQLHGARTSLRRSLPQIKELAKNGTFIAPGYYILEKSRTKKGQ